jgi:hypothetical protein
MTFSWATFRKMRKSKRTEDCSLNREREKGLMLNIAKNSSLTDIPSAHPLFL